MGTEEEGGRGMFGGREERKGEGGDGIFNI